MTLYLDKVWSAYPIAMESAGLEQGDFDYHGSSPQGDVVTFVFVKDGETLATVKVNAETGEVVE
jgi:hypothetical protein